MSDTYTKLFSSITESTVWGESYATRIVWVTMLAMADAKGAVYGSVPGLARRANVTLEEVEHALAAFLSPDPYSRTKADDGRRIEDIDGGWRLVNHAKYSAVRNAEERREYKRKWDRENRPGGKRSGEPSDTNPTETRQNPTNPTVPATPTPTPTPEDQELESANADSSTAAPVDPSPGRPKACPQQKIVDLYHEVLPELRRVREWNALRQKLLARRWAENPERQTLDWWRDFFGYVRKSRFLMGQTQGRDGRPFDCDLEWLVRPTNFVKVVEGRYEDQTQ